MKPTWKTELASALRRLESDISKLHGVRSLILHGTSEAEVNKPKSATSLRRATRSMTVRVKQPVKPFRRLVFLGKSDAIDRFAKHAEDLSDSLFEFTHPRIGKGWRGWKLLKNAGFSNDLAYWTLAIHQFARVTSDIVFYSLDTGESFLRPDQVHPGTRWNPDGPFVSLIEDMAIASSKFADWIINTDRIGDIPVYLAGEGEPAVVLGKKLKRPLASQQYAVVNELIRSYPNGLTEEELRKAVDCQNPRHVLLGLMGDRRRKTAGVQKPKNAEQLLWSKVIVPPGSRTDIGWTLKPI